MSIKPIKKLLIANRGEIACRILQTCKKMGIATVAVYSDIEQNAPFVKLADEAIHIGPPSAADSYLRGDKIIEAAKRVGVDAIHPGYGFLSENAEFAREVINSGIIFIGPMSESILAIGDKDLNKFCIEFVDLTTTTILKKKIEAKNLLAKHLPSVHLIPGYNGDSQNMDVFINESRKIGFPVILKAAAGGGGKGMRIVHEESKLQEAIELVKSESLQSFGSNRLLIEKYFESIRHVEGLRKNMIDAAIKIGKLLKYTSAGTVEFIVDVKENKYYFLEMNTRLQVEHPITELITGLDLVELQILVSQDPCNNFLPSIGKILHFKPSLASDVRYDTGVETALQKMRSALQNTVCLGIITNQQFLLQVMDDPNFISGKYDTNFIEHRFSLSKNQHIQSELVIIPFLWLWYIREKQRTTLKHVPSGWRYLKYKNFTDEYIVHNGNNVQVLELEYEYHAKLDGGKIGNSNEHIFSIWIKGDNNKSKRVVLKDVEIYENDGIQRIFDIASGSQNLRTQEVYVHCKELRRQIKFLRNKKKFYNENVEDDVPQNSKVSKDEAILTIESMKIETRIYSRHDGIVKILVKEGDVVDAGTVLIKIE
ncbi:12468_t:CDS:10 [Racocetra fulgida]|uniref:12468_t:CDS:1 n=1 Tax=Racocetra fulgida TaxID=60492 RepID=A0A9N9A897_9GLOM|nr:12468_t:CDS:10 [Racocetra fulgida]